MASDSGNQSPKIPAAGWVLVLVALGAFWAKDIPLQGSRPNDLQSRSDKYQSLQDVDARLWQDPLAVIERADATDRDKAKSGGADDIHSPCAIQATLADLGGGENKTAVNELTVLAVIVPGGPYAENAESRRRTRYAVVSGLRTKEFVPDNEDHLGYFRIDSVEGDTRRETDCDKKTDEAFLVPFERFNSRYLKARGQVLLLWLNSEKFERKPLTKIAQLITQIIPSALPECAPKASEPGDPRCVRLRILGPRGSGHFRDLLEELIDHWSGKWRQFTAESRNDLGESKDKYVLSQLKYKPYFYSYTATIADARLFQILRQLKLESSPRATGGKIPEFNSVQEFLALSEVKKYVEVRRTISQDDALADELVRELKLRDITIVPKMVNKNHSSGIALVSEWDSLFGRVLPSSICAALMKRYVPTREAHCSSVSPPAEISYYSYLRGLDGKTAQETGGEAKDAAKKPSTKNDKDAARSEAVQIEHAEGQGQFDYLRRMAASMKRNDQMLRGTTGRGYRAIGIVGSDVYDKLIVMQVLRPQFPEAIFFTTHLDARLLHPSENRWARNLIVASSFGFELDADEQRFIPPFRDGYQTAAFLATKIALTIDGKSLPFNVPQAELDKELAPPRVFEISGRSVVDLSAPAGERKCRGPVESCLHSRVFTFEKSMRLGFSLAAIILCCGGITVLLSRHARKRLAKLSTGLYAILTCWRTERTSRYLRTYHCISRGLAKRKVRCLLFVSVVVFSALAIGFGPKLVAGLFNWISEDGSGEPFSWFDGVSIWPTELIRLLALFLALYFITRGWSKLEENRRAIMRRFDLKRTERAIERDLVRRPFSIAGDDQSAQPRRKMLDGWSRFKRYVTTAFSSPRYRHRPDRDDTTGTRGRLQPDAVAFWRKYVYLNRWHVRVLRIVVLFFVLFIFNSIVFQIFGRPVAPVRGDISAALDQVILLSTVIAFQVLTIAALDATILCFRLITELRDHRTVWPDDARERMARKLRLKLSGPFGETAARVIDEWLDIQIIAKRSEAVERLIYYPMIVLSLMVLARNTAFDNWALTPALLIVYSINASIVVIAALMLRRAAESSRQHSLHVIRDSLSHYRMGGERGKPFADHIEQLAQQIAGLDNGAFARFSQQPLVRSVLLLIGSVGGTSLLELSALMNF